MPPRKKTAKPREDQARLGVIYARYSSHNQKEESIEQQVEECMAFAQQNGITVIQVYADKALSGRSDKRPQFQKMMRDAEKREFSVVVAYKSNRISRDMLGALKYEDRLSRCGIETLYAKEEFGNTAAGRFALRTMMNVNQFYSENMAEDIRRGMIDNAENCKVNGALPMGYIKGPDGKYAIEPQEAEIVRGIFTKVLEGVPFIDIANDLNARGIKTKQGNLWNKNSFSRMLTNDVYIGVYRHSGIVKYGGVPPILKEEVFYAMQNHLDTKKNPRGRHRESGDYLLTGKIFCGHCGAPMVGISGTSRTGAKHYYYNCNNRRFGGDCKKENVRRDDIEYDVAYYTKEYIMQDDTLDWIASCGLDMLRSSDAQSELAAMEAELADCKKAAGNIVAAIEQGIITATTKDRLLELEANISSLERTISMTKLANEDVTVSKQEFLWYLRNLRNGDINDKEFQKELIETFVEKVVLWDDGDGKLEVTYSHLKGKNVIVRSLLRHKKSGDKEAEMVRINSAEGHQTLKRTPKRCPF